MKKMLFLLAVGCSSCQVLIMKYIGMENPRVESVATINHYAPEIGVDTNHLLFVKDEKSLARINAYFGNGNELLAFDRQKRFLAYKEDNHGCTAPVDRVLLTICNLRSSEIHPNRLVSYDTLMEALSDPNGCLKQFPPDDYDMVVFMNFAKYNNGKNEEYNKVWNRIIRENPPSCKVLFLHVNYDYRDTFGYPLGNKIKLKLRH